MEGSLAGLRVVDTFDVVSGEGADEDRAVVAATAEQDLGDAGDRELALEGPPGGGGEQDHVHLNALRLIGQAGEVEQLVELQRPPDDLDLVHGDMNQHGSGHSSRPFC